MSEHEFNTEIDEYMKIRHHLKTPITMEVKIDDTDLNEIYNIEIEEPKLKKEIITNERSNKRTNCKRSNKSLF